MAVRYAVATGNWSNVATWDGGAALPVAGDVVHADGWTVTIDQSINVESLRTTARGGGVAGGGFTVAAGGYTLDLTGTSGLVPGTTTVLTTTHAAGTTTVNGHAINANSTSTAHCALLNGTGTLQINGNVSASTTGAGGHGASTNASGTLVIVGNVTGGSQTGVGVLVGAGSPTVNITGMVTGGTNTGCLFVSTAGVPNITIVGNCAVGSNVQGRAIYWSTAGGTLAITGAVTGGTNNHCIEFSSGSTPTVSITGTVTGGSGAYGVVASSSITLTITGSIVATSGLQAVYSIGVGATNTFSGPFVSHSSGVIPFFVHRMKVSDDTANYYRFAYSAGGTVDFVTSDSLAGLPAEADVRDSTTYGAVGEFTGTLIVPDPQYVLAGVPTDNTVGTAALTPADFWDYPVTSIVVAGSIGERAKNCATPDTTGAQIAAFGQQVV